MVGIFQLQVVVFKLGLRGEGGALGYSWVTLRFTVSYPGSKIVLSCADTVRGARLAGP